MVGVAPPPLYFVVEDQVNATPDLPVLESTNEVGLDTLLALVGVKIELTLLKADLALFAKSIFMP